MYRQVASGGVPAESVVTRCMQRLPTVLAAIIAAGWVAMIVTAYSNTP